MAKVKFIDVGKFKQCWEVSTTSTHLDQITRLARARKGVVPAGATAEQTLDGQGVIYHRKRVIGFYQVVP